MSDAEFADFTEQGYREVLAAATARYRFELFGTSVDEPHVLWRHDVDLSMHRAARIARLEADAGVRSTFFLFFHSTFYNLLERPLIDLARSIAALGHDIGLHFDSSFYGSLADVDLLAKWLTREASLLADLIEQPVRAFSFHNPGNVNDDLAFDDDEIAGLANAYGRMVRSRYGYVSDANGYWRFERLMDVLTSGQHERLHVLTHPGWWQVEPLAPRQRIVRCIQGRADATLRDYDELLTGAARRNIG